MLTPIFFSLAKDTSIKPSWRYGILLGILGMIVMEITPHMRGEPFTPGVINRVAVTCMLLLSHLAFSFPWPLRMRVLLKVCALVAVVGVCVYVTTHH